MSRRGLLAFLLIVACTFFACKRNSYEIEGTAEGFSDGDTLLLTIDFLSARQTETIVIDNGKFGYRGKADSAMFCELHPLSDAEEQVMFFAEPNATICVRLQAGGQSRVWGTGANEAWQELSDMCNAYEQHVESMVEAYYSDDVSESELQSTTERIGRLDRAKDEWLRQFAERNKDNAMGAFLRNNVIYHN